MQKSEFLKKIETELRISRKSNKTIKSYIFFNNKLLEFCKKEPEQISINDIKQFLAEKLSNKSSGTIILALAAIRYSFEKILGKDPTAGIERPRKEKKIPEVLSKEEVKKLIENAETKKSKFIIKLLYSTGMRVSELCNLKLNDLNLNEKIGWIRQGKGKKDRIFIISEKLTQEIEQYMKGQQEQNYSYLLSKEKPLTPRNIQKIIKLAAKKAGINKKVTPHTLRHSYATHLLEAGTDIRKIQALLGHENLNTTQIYTHISTEELKKVKSAFDEL